jgi:hypothetical protein
MDKIPFPERRKPAEPGQRTEITLRPRVAQYVRTSAEHQHSMESQCDLIRLYAEANHMVIAGTYSDQDSANLDRIGS